MNNENITIEKIVRRWDSAERPLFRGCLIDKNGCCCAQGDVLRLAGKSDEELRTMKQYIADREVARLLNISITHSVLLRHVNDKNDGCPQDVLQNPEKILGVETTRILKFWRWVDQPAYAYAYVADTAAAYVVGGSGDAADAAHASAAYWFYRRVRGATLEIIGHTKLMKYYFLPLLGFENVEALDKLAGENE